MGNEKESEVKVNDRRRFDSDGSAKEDAPEVKEGPSSEDPKPAAEIHFPAFILSLASSVQISLGLIPHPVSKKQEMDLRYAKQTIDILALLDEKTKGNLSKEEDQLLKAILFDLRMQFVEAKKKT